MKRPNQFLVLRSYCINTSVPVNKCLRLYDHSEQACTGSKDQIKLKIIFMYKGRKIRNSQHIFEWLDREKWTTHAAGRARVFTNTLMIVFSTKEKKECAKCLLFDYRPLNTIERANQCWVSKGSQHTNLSNSRMRLHFFLGVNIWLCVSRKTVRIKYN